MSNRNCKACRKNLSKASLKLQCGRCCGYFHLECGNISELEARLMQSQKTPWNCEECANNIARRKSLLQTHSPPKTADGDMQELKSMIKELQNEIKDVKRSMDFINEKFEEERERNRIMSEMVSEISKDNKVLRERVERLERALEVENGRKVQQNICISGFPINKEGGGKVASNDLAKLFSSLEVVVNPSDFLRIHQFSTSKGQKISVTLKDRDLKNRILTARAKKGKITPRICGLGQSDTAIYLDEELSKETYHLFKKAKALKDLGYKYVWHRNGKILARKSDGDNAVLIKSESIIDELSN